MEYMTPVLYTGAKPNPNLGPVSGTAPTAIGTYDLCFVDTTLGHNDYASAPATLTVN